MHRMSSSLFSPSLPFSLPGLHHLYIGDFSVLQNRFKFNTCSCIHACIQMYLEGGRHEEQVRSWAVKSTDVKNGEVCIMRLVEAWWCQQLCSISIAPHHHLIAGTSLFGSV